MVLLEFSMSPIGKGESLSPYIARILRIIDKSGVTYRLTPMGTVLEGDWETVFGVVSACFDELKRDCARIAAHIKVDYRNEEKSRIQSKVTTVENLLGKPLSKF